ncbi:hypothetical protein JXB41_06720 [Candidatus Woesearchaeota archaeon]|nr:hypothetical protein [Candidatus Woesearchaeota archaeon]
MHTRKLQLIAGTTYTVSLPKEWIKKNRLTKNNEILIAEKSDGSLIVNPFMIRSGKTGDTFNLNIDDYREDIGQILFSLFYLGYENINIISKSKIPHNIKSIIKSVQRNMAGTEIIYEDPFMIKFKVLLDKSKIDINQLYYRISLLINSSIENLLNNLTMNEINRNEEDIDRLYHLIAKIIQLSHLSPDILLSSKINNIYFLSSYLLIAKKLENIGDSLHDLALYVHENSNKIKSINEALLFIKKNISRGIRFFMSKESSVFIKTNKHIIKNMEKKIEQLNDLNLIKHLDDALRYLVDVEDELTNISFYKRLIKANLI